METETKFMPMPQGRVITIEEMSRLLKRNPPRDIHTKLDNTIRVDGVGAVKIGSMNTPSHARQREKNPDDSKDLYHTMPQGAWEGARCFVIGGGESLKEFDWNLLRGELTIATNRVFEYFDPTIALFLDYRLYEAYTDLTKNILIRDPKMKHPHELWREAKCMKVFCRISAGAFDPSIYTMPFAGNDCLTRCMTDGLGCGENTGYAALQLAILLGAKEIYLLGIDMQGQDGLQVNFHPGYISPQADFVYKSKFKRYFEKYAPEMESRGVRVVSVNTNTTLRCFPIEYFPPVVRRPIYVSCYTEDTHYAEHAKQWVKCMQRFSLEHHIEPYESSSDWKKNTRYKPGFIQRMLRKFPDRDIVWLDVDGRVRRYPSKFCNFAHDIACFEFDPAAYDLKHTQGPHLANGTLYLRNKPLVRDFVQDWVNSTTRDQKGTDLTSFHKTANDWKTGSGFEVCHLPPEYCKMASFMPDVIPVFEHLQASRKKSAPTTVKRTSEILLAEQTLYQKAWAADYRPSRCVVPMARYIASRARKHDKILEFGCGECSTLNRLNALGLNIEGMDITAAGWSRHPENGGHATVNPRRLYVATLWDMKQFADDQFDFTFSTDLLEHIPPELVETAIREIYRVTRRATHHVIACFAHAGDGVVYHKTVHPITWWQQQFRDVYDFSPPEVHIVDRVQFLSEDFDRG